MKKYVYVATHEDIHSVIGVYSDPSLAVNAIWSLSPRSAFLNSIHEEPTGTRYTLTSFNTGKTFEYFIEKVELDERFWAI